MNQYTFHLFHKGDPSVGIWDANTTVTVTSDFQYDQDDLQSFKESLADMFDVPVKYIQTQAEFEEQQKQEREYEKSMDDAEESLRKEIDGYNEDNFTFI